MNIEETKDRIQMLTAAAKGYERSGYEVQRILGGGYGVWELEKAKEIREQIALLQGQIDREENPDEIFF